MAVEPARAAEEVARPVLEFGFTANSTGVSVSLRINNKPLAAAVLGGLGLALGVFYFRNRELAESAIKSAFAGLCQVQNIRPGSIRVEVYCDTEQTFLSFMEAFETNKVKQRLEEEFQKVGYKEELEVVIINDKEVNEKLNVIRRDRNTKKKESKDEEVHQIPGVCRDLSDLPLPVSHFVNRKKELYTIKKYLSPDPENYCKCALVHGAVGVGKTTTAIKAANEIRDNDENTVVVYINCKYVSSLNDLAGKISKQLYNFLTNEPIPEVKRRLANEKMVNAVLLLDNYEHLLHLNGKGRAMIYPNEGFQIMKFIVEIVTASQNVKLLVTSSENVVFPETGQQRIRLHPFQKEDSFQLLKHAFCNRAQVAEESASQIADACDGIPLALVSLASSVDHPADLVEMITATNQKLPFELFTIILNPDESEPIDIRLNAGFNRLNQHLQDSLVSLTLFRGPFTISKAVEIFQSEGLTDQILELALQSFLEEDIRDTAASSTCWYSLLTVIKLFCQKKVLMDTRIQEVYGGARKLFIEHFMAFLEDTFKSFLSKDASRAIITFGPEEENLLQLLEWLENGAMDENQTYRCIDVFNEVGELLAKMMAKKKFEMVFSLLKEKCAAIGDQERLSECLTSLGINEVFSCSCTPGLCYEAADRAKKHLAEANRIQTALSINTGNSRAQCLAKLGRCLTKEDQFREGKEMIQQAIDIRRRRGEEDSVMLGATYNDMAVALSLVGDHQQAVTVRQEQTLPIYMEKLGEHPFTATILNNLSNNFHALGEFDKAKLNSKKALEIRLELLKNHMDTAKSLFDLGMVLKEKKEFREAKYYLEQTETMQMVLNENVTDLERTRKELEDVRKLLARKG